VVTNRSTGAGVKLPLQAHQATKDQKQFIPGKLFQEGIVLL
jgi:hypothetical protein